MNRNARAALLLFALAAPLASGSVARADAPPPAASGNGGGGGSVVPRAAPQGVAVLAMNGARDEAFSLARAVYGSRLRPPSLDEVRARVLAGDPPPPTASRELRELAEVRASVRGEDVASRRLLAGIAQQVGAQALLVVRVETADVAGAAAVGPAADAGAPAPDEGPSAAEAEAGVPAAAPTRRALARLVLVEGAELDAAQYAPDADGSWRGTVASLERRFPPPSTSASAPDGATKPGPASLKPEPEKSKPFYASPWFWGAVGGALVLGAAFYFGSRDTTPDSIQIDMRVPR